MSWLRTVCLVLISVLTPTRNRATSFLPDALASTACQVLPPSWSLEHVVCDDASDPAERAELVALAQRFPHVRLVLREQSGGVSAARNDAFRASSGDVIVDLDDDDMLPSRSIADRVEHLLASGRRWSCGDMLKVDTAGCYKVGFDLACRLPEPLSDQQCLDMLLAGQFYAWSGTRTYLRSALEAAGPWDESFPVAEDLEHWMRLTAIVGAPSWCERWLVIFREKEASLGIDAVRSGLMESMCALARERWSGHRPGAPLPPGLPRW